MSKILLLSTPLNDNYPGISLVEEPKAIIKIQETEKKIQVIMGFADQFWRSTGGIIWNPSIGNSTYNGRKGFSVKIPKSSNREFSFLNAQNFPNEWSIEQRNEYVNLQVEKILRYTAVNTLWLSQEKEWDRCWDRFCY